jgi:chemotaxis methyl-accepting protein methylase
MGDNTIICCRNLWIYLKPHEKEQLAYYLGKNLGENSTIILGFLDHYEGYAGKLLEKNGFKRCPLGTEYTNILYSKN